jgi:hypothetical protein
VGVVGIWVSCSWGKVYQTVGLTAHQRQAEIASAL